MALIAVNGDYYWFSQHNPALKIPHSGVDHRSTIPPQKLVTRRRSLLGSWPECRIKQPPQRIACAIADLLRIARTQNREPEQKRSQDTYVLLRTTVAPPLSSNGQISGISKIVACN